MKDSLQGEIQKKSNTQQRKDIKMKVTVSSSSNNMIRKLFVTVCTSISVNQINNFWIQLIGLHDLSHYYSIMSLNNLKTILKHNTSYNTIEKPTSLYSTAPVCDTRKAH